MLWPYNRGGDPWGGYLATTATGNITLTGASQRHQRIDPNGSNRNVTLPAEETSKGRVFVIDNTGTANTLVVKDDAANTISTLAIDERGVFACNGTNWLGEVVPFNASGNVAQNFQNGIKLAGTSVSASAAELNYLDIATLGTGAASKAVVLDAGDDYTWPATGVLTYGVLKDPAGTTLGATSAEINAVADVSARVVDTTATVLAVTATQHAGRIVRVSSTGAIAITLPAATGTGDIYTFLVNVAATATAHTIKVANTADALTGVSIIAQTDTAQVNGFLTTATDDTITLDGTTKGGLKGDKIVIVDMATAAFQVTITGGASGTVATPFSATV